jgi:hypothetical protein
MRDEQEPAADVADFHVLDPNPPESKTEPAMMVAKRIMAFILAVVAIAVAFGFVAPLTPEQSQAIADNLLTILTGLIALIGVVMPLVQGKLTRDRVVSPATAERLAVANTNNGYQQGLVSGAKPNPILPLY